MLNQVYDLIRNPPADKPYTSIKEAIIRRFSESSMARLEKLSTGIQLGDGKPSHLLTQLQQTNATSDESVVRRYWIKRLPPAARAVIVGMLDSTTISLNQLAITADAVLDSLGGVSSISTLENQVNAVSPKTSIEKRIDGHDALLQQINDKLSKLLGGNNDRHRSREPSQSRHGRSNTPHRSYSNDNQSTCWYHQRYGTHARRCLTPCDFTSTSSTSSKN